MIDANKEGNSCIDLSRNSAFLQKENRAPEQETSVDIKSMVNRYEVDNLRSFWSGELLYLEEEKKWMN